MKNFKTSHRLAAAITTGAMLGSSGSAFAGVTDARALVDNIITASTGFTNLLSLLGYIGGSGMAVAGIFKLKQHVDNPGQTPMKDGVMRLATGGALLSLPFVTATMQGSIAEANGGATANQAQVSIAQFQPVAAAGG